MLFRGSPLAHESPDQAIDALWHALEAAWRRPTPERSALSNARGRFLAEAITLDRDSPPFDASVMDGYAVRAKDLPQEGAFSLDVRAESRIGQAPPAMTAGAAVRIATGAAIPQGADAVIPRERVREIPDGQSPARIEGAFEAGSAPRVGEHIRRRGEHARAGSDIAGLGDPLTASIVGALASAGRTNPLVQARLRVQIVITGEELVSAETSADDFTIRDSNGPALLAALSARAWLHAQRPIHEPGDAKALEATLLRLRAESHAIVTCGGISMGHRDPVRQALESIGARIVFHGLPQRPGKPVLGAVMPRADGSAIPLLALPGNPLSAMVTCERIVVPLLARCAGGRLARAPGVRLAACDGKSLPLWWHRLARMLPDGTAELVGLQGSGDIPAAARADGFVELPPGQTGAGGNWPFHAWPS
jgi:molybdopterin molybdotransferase